MTQATLKQYAQTWAQMTDENRHSEVLENIADIFAQYSSMKIYGKYSIIFTSIRTLHKTEGHLPYELYQYRYAKMHELLNTIEQHDGKEARDIVYNCL